MLIQNLKFFPVRNLILLFSVCTILSNTSNAEVLCFKTGSINSGNRNVVQVFGGQKCPKAYSKIKLATEPALQGPTGATGATGTAGLNGEAGPIGPAGATGASGNSVENGIAGPAGASGPTGAAGATGPTGAVGATGALGINFVGEWDSSTVYAHRDAVLYGGSTYFSITGNVNLNPSQNSSEWKVIAQSGSPGLNGSDLFYFSGVVRLENTINITIPPGGYVWWPVNKNSAGIEGVTSIPEMKKLATPVITFCNNIEYFIEFTDGPGTLEGYFAEVEIENADVITPLCTAGSEDIRCYGNTHVSVFPGKSLAFGLRNTDSSAVNFYGGVKWVIRCTANGV